MSINALTNSAAARRPDIGPPDQVPDGLAAIAAAASTPPENAPSHPERASGVTTALNILFGYIPTEIVTLYVAVCAALQSPSAVAATTAVEPSEPFQARWIAFWCFFGATPIVVWLAYATKLKAAGKSLPSTYSTWPVWEMSAALVAYCAWAFALPDSPFKEFDAWYSPALATIAILVVSAGLGLIAPIFQRPLGTG